ncbi:MAG TPA: F0F1 ATP synthase subunit A [Pyrinomonadaceae bacterium]|nr:F0F1 ATP synthase subunit A [Pyrinomonadaceae bacterium]
MFWLLQAHGEEGAAHGATAAPHAETAGAAAHGGGAAAAHHTPPLVEAVNHFIGEPVHNFQMAYTKPVWDNLFHKFGTDAETVFGAYTVDNAVPWYTVMFIVACLLTLAIIWILKGKYLSEDEPSGGQQTLEVTVLAVRDMVENIIGPHGLKYFPVVGTFALLILVSNLMGLFPMFMPPTAHTSVTFALGITSFFYYNYIGVKENGLMGHLGHFAGVHYFSGAILFIMGPAMFVIELISNAVRPLSLGLRLFGNIFGDEQVAMNLAGVGAPYTYWVLPAILMVLTVFASVMQAFIFTLLSMIYIGEVSHAPHEDHDDAHGNQLQPIEGDEIIAPAL